MTLLLLSIFFGVSLNAADFGGHTEFESHNFYGKIRVTCFGDFTETVVHNCRAQGLLPGERAHFNHYLTEQVDRVKLVSHRADGRVIRRSSNWNSKKHQSKKRFNLWINTLLQTPLLSQGVNAVVFELWNDHTSIESGSFNVTVREGGDYQCKTLDKQESGNTLCDNSVHACQYYFNVQDDCEKSK